MTEYFPPLPTELVPIYCDDAIIVVDKPSGLLSVPGRGPGKEDCMASRVQAEFSDALIVHRLDMSTSGLMVFARGSEHHRTLSMDFAARRVDKRYVAVVAGIPAKARGEIDLPLITDWPNRPRQMVDFERGKPSLTRFEVISGTRGDDHSRLLLEPVTGRSHQLRLHLWAIGHPILGDELYGDVAARAPRLLLHACRLALQHPVDGRRLEFASLAPF